MTPRDFNEVHTAATRALQAANDAVTYADTALRKAREAQTAARSALDQIEAMIRKVASEKGD